MMTALISRRFTVALGLLALGGLGVLDLAAQTPAGRQKLAFVAMTADGQPIPDLKPAQVELKIDGKVRQVQTLELVKLGGGSTEAAAPKALFDNPIPPPFGENVATPGRNILIAIDEESMRPGSEKALKEKLDQFVGALGAADKAAFVTMPHGTIATEPTTNKTALRDAIAKIGGRLPQDRSDDEDRCHSRDVLDTLTGMFQRFGEGPTSVVVFSAGLLSPQTATGTCQLSSTEFQKTGAAAAAAHAIVYVVLPETTATASQSSTSSATNNMAGLQSLAGSVNSPLLNLANADPPLTKVLRESGNYFVAEIDFDAAERDGKSHRVDLKVTAPGASVRAPSEVTFAKAGANAGSKANAKDLVKDGKIYTDLPIRVIGYVSKATEKDKVKVLGMVAPVDPSVKFSSLSISFTDPNGKGQTYNVPADGLSKGQYLGVLEVAPGSWRVHAAAVDAASGRVGSADYQLDAQLAPAGPMSMSGLLLGVKGPNGFMPQIAFSNEAEIVAQYELYGNTTSGIDASVEIAETPDGPAVKDGKLELKKTAEERFLIEAMFDIKDLKPGDYVVRAKFQVENTPAGKIIRTLRKLK